MKAIVRVRATLAALGALAALGGTARTAAAQLPIMPRVGVKAGAFLPNDTSFNNLAGNTWFKAGVDVGLPFSLVPAIGSARAEIDYQVNGRNNIVPITFNQIVQPSIGLHVPLYFGAGAGIWTGHIRGAGSSTTVGGRLIAGLELSKAMFVEAQYDFVGRIGGVRADGPSVLAGMRF